MAAINWFRFASPAAFFPMAGILTRVFGIIAVGLAVAGLYVGFAVAPTDAQQGESYRIIFIHVPAAWMAMLIYVVIAFWSLMTLTLNARLPAMMAQALAPTGAMFAFIALWTGDSGAVPPGAPTGSGTPGSLQPWCCCFSIWG